MKKRVRDQILLARENEFWAKYKDVMMWINSDKLKKRFVGNDSINIFLHEMVYFKKTYNKDLPVTDSDGVVDIDDLVLMFELEGFKCAILRDNEAEVCWLEVKL